MVAKLYRTTLTGGRSSGGTADRPITSPSTELVARKLSRPGISRPPWTASPSYSPPIVRGARVRVSGDPLTYVIDTIDGVDRLDQEEE